MNLPQTFFSSQPRPPQSLWMQTQLLHKSLEFYRLLAARKEIEIQLQDLSTDPQLQTDPHLAAQLLGNLLSNAIKYSPYQSQIQVQVTSETEGLQIGIQDAGPGLSEADQAKIFQKYATLNSPTQGQQAHGLGLYLAQGSLFWLRFPFSQTEKKSYPFRWYVKSHS